MSNSTAASANPSSPPPPSRPSRRRRLLRWAAWGAAGLAGLGLLVLVALQTPAGLSAAAALTSRIVSAATGLTVRLEDVSGHFPVSLTLGRLAVADAKGVWFVAKDLHLAWSPLALLGGRIRVDALTADIIRVRRPPELPPAPQAPPQIEWPPRFPTLPPILVDKLAVNRLLLDKELAGQDAELGITGRLAESGQGAVALSLNVERRGGPPLALQLAGSLNYADWRLAVQASLTDAAGGLLAEALAGTGGGPLDCRLTGDGSLADWRGKLAVSLAGRPFAGADLGLAVPLTSDAVAAWSLDARFTPPTGQAPAWAADLDRLLGHGAQLAAAGRYGIVSGAVFLDKTAFTVDAGQVTATASLRPDTQALSAAVELHVPEVGRLDPGLSGALAAKLTATGKLNRPDVALTVTAKAFRAGSLGLADARVHAAATLAGDLDGPFPGATVTASGDLTGLAGPDGTTLLGRDLRLTLAADAAPSGAVTAREVSLVGQEGALRLSGETAADGALAAKLGLTVRNLAGAASLGGLTLSGGVEATADVRRDAAGAGKAALAVRLAKLATTASTGPSAGLVGLLGATPALSATVDMAGTTVRVADLALDGGKLQLRGAGDLDTASGRMAAKVAADLPDLTPLTAVLGQPAAGELHLTVDLGGPAGAPTVATKAQAKALRLGETRLAALDLEATAKNLTKAPAGRIRLSARRDQETADLETNFALTGQSLRLSDLRLTAPETTLAASATIDLDKGAVAGTLSAASADLGGLGRFVGQPLAGSLKLSATAASGRAGQEVSAKLTAASLRAAGLAVGELSLSADLSDLLTLPRGRASLAAKGLDAGGLNLTQLACTVSGDGKALEATVDTQGTLPGGKPLTLATKARLAQAGKTRTVTVASLSGTLQRHPFALTAPAVLTLAGDRTELAALNLTFDKAVIAASGSLAPRAVTGTLTLGKLSLPLLAGFGVTGFDGTAGATVTLSGSPAKPRLVAEAKIDGLRTTSPQGRGVPAMAVATTATLDGTTLSATASLAQAGKKNVVTAQVALPAKFSLEPFALTLPPGGALSGKLTADGDLTDLAGLLAQANMRVVGKLAAALTLSGTLANPDVSGSLGLTASRLESADAGLVLRDVVIRLDAAGGVLTVTKATGQDLRGGSFAISGKIGPLAAADPPISLTTKLSHLRVAGLDLVTATADGSVAVTGTLSRIAARGKITIGPAEINLPTSLPPSVVVIPVTDINDPKAKPAAKKAAPPAAARRVDLDVTVALGRAVYIRGMGMQSRWGGEVAITGTADAPVGRGKFYVEQGRIDLFGGNLDITKGEVAFDGQSVTAPSLSILATNTIDDVTAGVSLTGDAANPTIALTSKPPLPDNEILSRILFGQSASSLSAIQAAQLAQAAASLYAGGGPTSILARTRHILGLDQLSIVQGKGNLTTTMLKASKEIVKGVTVGVEQGMGAQSGAVSVEVKITPNITVDSRVGADNKQGVGVNWKWDY